MFANKVYAARRLKDAHPRGNSEPAPKLLQHLLCFHAIARSIPLRRRVVRCHACLTSCFRGQWGLLQLRRHCPVFSSICELRSKISLPEDTEITEKNHFRFPFSVSCVNSVVNDVGHSIFAPTPVRATTLKHARCPGALGEHECSHHMRVSEEEEQ
jgi:hypothetical protein